jgi:hypothetical protein
MLRPADRRDPPHVPFRGRNPYEIHQDKSGEWRWPLRASDGQLVADGGEGFA